LRQGRLSLAHVERALDTWTAGLERGAVELVPNSVDLRRAANLSCQLSHAVADCLYLALAERLDARLVTADVTFARRASTDYGAVRLLSDLDNG
jgi:predicted nucleic acid-binding protein